MHHVKSMDKFYIVDTFDMKTIKDEVINDKDFTDYTLYREQRKTGLQDFQVEILYKIFLTKNKHILFLFGLHSINTTYCSINQRTSF